MQLHGPTYTINPPPPLPSQQACSHTSIQGIHHLWAHLYVHTVSGPAVELSQQCACTSAGPLIHFTPPIPTISVGPQPCFHLGHSPSAGPLKCSHSRQACRYIPTAVCMQLCGPAHTFNPPTPTVPAGPQPCFHLGHSLSASPLKCSHSQWAHRCIPTVVYMLLHRPAHTFNSPIPTIPAGPQLCFHLGHSLSTGPLVYSYSWWARHCIPTVVCMQLHGPTHTFYPPIPTIPAGPQLCSHLGHSPFIGSLVCSHTLWAHCCIPTVVCMQLCGPPHMFHPPPPPPSQQAHSYVSILDMYLLQAHSCAHTLSRPAAASPLYADSSVGPLICSNPPSTPSQQAHSYVSISYMHLP